MSKTPTLSFTQLTDDAIKRVSEASQPTRRPRKTDHQVQMSIRMEEDTYALFRSVAEAEGRTNGDMIERLLTTYLYVQEQGVKIPQTRVVYSFVKKGAKS